jgi:HEAT repeat protein
MMKQLNLEAMTVDQLVKQFSEIGVAQDGALLENAINKFNHLYDQMEAVELELKIRSGDQRRILLSLYSHPNMQVRLSAAKATLAIAPQAARDALLAIKASKSQPQALDAGMSLRNLDKGIYKPT